jgi:Na+-transporting methylmalonyl-CoA/oxaloacetate decarboxylase gamma subunit
MVLLGLYIAFIGTVILGFLIFLILKLYSMSDQATEIKELLTAANEKVAKVAADVALLHAKIDALPNTEELAEIKSLSTALNDSLQVVDDATPEETPA